MATIYNKRDLFLSSTSPRLIDPAGLDSLRLSASSSTLSYIVNPADPTTLNPTGSVAITPESTRRGTTYNWTVSIPSGQYTLVVSNNIATITVNNTWNTDSLVVTCIATSPLYEDDSTPGTESVVAKSITITKQVPAPITKTLQLYQRKAGTTPVSPSSSTYAFGNNTITNLGFWSTTIPGGDDPLYTTTTSVTSYSSTSMVAIPITWTTTSLYQTNGTTAKTVSLASSGLAFMYLDGRDITSTSPTLNLTVNQQNITLTNALITIQRFNKSGGTIDISPSTLSSSGLSTTLSAATFETGGTVIAPVAYAKIIATLDGISDTVTILRVEKGTDSSYLILDNEAHVVPASSDGTVTSFAGASTNVKVFKGIVDDTSNWTINTVGSNVSYTFVGGLCTITALSADTGSVTFTATRTGYTTLERIFTISKSRAGAAAQYVTVTGEQAFKYLPNSSTPTASTILLTAVLAGGLTTYNWEYYNGSSWVSLGTTTSTYTLSYSGIFTGQAIRIRCTSGGYNDEITVVKLYDGSDTVAGYLTNESVSVSAAADGTVASYATASGNFKVFKGITDVTNSSTYSVTTATKNGLTFSINSTTGAYSVSGTWTTDSESFDVVAVFAGVTPSVTITKQYTISKSKVGTQGATGPTGPSGSTGATGDVAVTAYRTVYNLASMPAAPGVGTGTPTSGSAPSASDDGIWYTNPPSSALSNGYWLFMKSGTKTSGGVYTWTSPSFLATFKVGSLSALSADLGTITAGDITLTGGAGKLYMSSTSLKATNSAGTDTYIEFTPGGSAIFQGSSTVGGGNYAALSAVSGNLSLTQPTYAAIYAARTATPGGQAIMADSTSGNVGGSAITAQAANSLSVGIKAVHTVAGSIAIDCQGVMKIGNSSEARATWWVNSGPKWDAYTTSSNSNFLLAYNNGAPALTLTSSAGDLTVTGNVTAYSDIRIKENIKPITNALSKIKSLNGYQYKNMLANRPDCGIIAQEVEKILPELITVGENEFNGEKLKTVNYNGIIALLVSAINELQTKVDRLTE